MAKRGYDILFKCLPLGDSGVGKTCLLVRFSDDAFSSTFISTIGIDLENKTIDVGGKKIKLQLWDTAGQERFRTMATAYYRGVMGIVLVYHVTQAQSFESITNWLRRIDEPASEYVERLLLGNKSDMEERRVVTRARGEDVARRHGIAFHETSAKTGAGVVKAFYELVEVILDRFESQSVTKSPTVLRKPEMDSRSEGTLNCCR